MAPFPLSPTRSSYAYTMFLLRVFPGAFTFQDSNKTLLKSNSPLRTRTPLSPTSLSTRTVLYRDTQCSSALTSSPFLCPISSLLLAVLQRYLSNLVIQLLRIHASYGDHDACHSPRWPLLLLEPISDIETTYFQIYLFRNVEVAIDIPLPLLVASITLLDSPP